MENQNNSNIKRKIRILCLHGYMTNKEFMQFQLKQWQSIYFKDKYEFFCINGQEELPPEAINDPRVVQTQKLIGSQDKKVYTWFNTRKSNIIDSYVSSMNYILEQINEHGPFEGLLGFSQGGVTVQLFIEWLKGSENAKRLKYQPQFLIIICSGSQMTPFKNIFDNRKEKIFQNQIPSIHLIGENDFLYEIHLALTSFYLDPVIIFHNSGHKIPRLDEIGIKTMKKFIKKSTKNQIQEKNKCIMPSL